MENWSIELNPNESLKVTADDDKLFAINQVALGEIKDGKDVEDIHVYFNPIDDGKKEVLATLSSKGARQACTCLVLGQSKMGELSHDRKDGSVHISGRMYNFAGWEDYYGHGAPVPVKISEGDSDKNYLFDDVDAFFSPQLTSSSTSSVPPIEDCMEIVTCFPGFEEGSCEYLEALCVFVNKSARKNFMIRKTNATRMEFLKTLIAGETNKDTT